MKHYDGLNFTKYAVIQNGCQRSGRKRASDSGTTPGGRNRGATWRGGSAPYNIDSVVHHTGSRHEHVALGVMRYVPYNFQNEKTNMNGCEVEGLIELVKQHVYLYDISHKKYKDATLKAVVWDSIAKQLDRNCEAVKLKWKTVRDGYIKYKKMLKQAEESGKKVIEYRWSSQLSFLDQYTVTRKLNPVLSYAFQPQVQMFEEANGSPGSHSPAQTQWDADDEPLAKRKKTVEKGDIDQILNYISSTRTKPNDAVDHLFMSYAETFKKFSPRRQAELKIELAKLFSNAELNELQDFQNSDDLQTDLYNIKSENMT